MATESNYLSVDWWSLPPNKQLPHYPSELHPPPFSCRSTTTPPSALSFLIQSSVDSFCVGCSSAIESIIYSYLICVQLLDLLLGGKPGLNWSIAGFMSTSSVLFQWGKKIITWASSPVSKQPGSFKAHHLHPRCSSEGHDLLASTSSSIRHYAEWRISKAGIRKTPSFSFWYFESVCWASGCPFLRCKWQSLCVCM